MISEKERMIEWLNRAVDDVHSLRKKARLAPEKKLATIRDSYSMISVLIKVAKGDAYMIGVPPPKS